MRRVEAARPLPHRQRRLRTAPPRSTASPAPGSPPAPRARPAAGLLDFDDLIDRAQALLARPGTAAWVLWRLDGGLDHILVDEAQDTSPAQWQVIEALSAEFFAGAGARDVARTIFVVGDEKQSIYSFQGADPAEFGAKRRPLPAGARPTSAPSCSAATCSIPSAPPGRSCALVDAVFAGAAGDGPRRRGIAHHAIDPDSPAGSSSGRSCPSPTSPTSPPGTSRSTPARPTIRSSVLARRIAAEIAGWLAARRALPGDRRPRRSAPAT